MILLREFANDFDKVITMSKETFISRAKQRNDYTPGIEGTEGWKQNLDTAISNVDKSKVISTDKYLSDLFTNTHQEQLKKFAELQERLNNKEFLEGAKNAFESSKGLQEWGTQEQYNDYIARVSLGIVKNPTSGEYNYESKVKDIVYHGTNNPNFSGFGSDFSRAIHFGTLQAAKDRRLHTDFEFKRNAKFIPVILNIKNPLKTEVDFNFEGEGLEFVDDPDFDFTKEQGHRLLITYLHNKGYNVYHPEGGVYRDGEILNNAGLDSVIYKNEREDKGNYSYAVFEPEQIHILSSKADIQGFKDFMSFENSEFSKYGTYQQFRDFVTSKSSIEIENRLIETGKINRVC